MNVDALRIFYEVAKLQSVSKAAKSLGVKQPTVSTSLQTLEREIGAQLVDRSCRPLRLTPAGVRLHSAARIFMLELDRAFLDIKELQDDIVGPLSVASIYSVGLYHAESIRRFMVAYPRVTVRLQYLRPNLVVRAVEDGSAVLGLISYPKATRDLVVVDWREEEMVVACPIQHPLAKFDSIKLAQLAGEAVIGFDPDLEIRRRTDEAFQKQKIEVRVVLEFDNIETVKQAVQVGSGVAILPADTVAHAVEMGAMAAVNLTEPALRRPVGIIYRRQGKLKLPTSAIRFIETLTAAPFNPT